eukprot:TRINITY_DN18612_c0_g1_i3.p1 TRINITY_DN18612_c0_g1~~TRINITY_DN18612_c0_g1_i3.p1  ORF type:complete len:271 (+),score=37.19 TRINITY_DN18612_c0_g1_i3:167-979(+)
MKLSGSTSKRTTTDANLLGTPLWRPTAHGTDDTLSKSPTYERIVRWLAGFFGVEPRRSIVNYYRNGDDFTSPHSDQYHGGVNMTIGASFGEERALLFEHRDTKEQFNFPQYNGDIFAFTDEVNNKFTHAVPKVKRRSMSTGRRCGSGRISVIVWARRDQTDWKKGAKTLPLHLLDNYHIVPTDPNAVAEGDEEEKPMIHPHFPDQPIRPAVASAGDLPAAGAGEAAEESVQTPKQGAIEEATTHEETASGGYAAETARPARRWAGRGRQA